ncbi:MAG: TatD family hydrolase [Bacteroidales bacterium]|nr:TatD family hydrolase [Bacteroidales bacterium]
MVNTLIDIHTHHGEPGMTYIKNLFPENVAKTENPGYFSMGLHPWYIDLENVDKKLELVNQVSAKKNVLAIGETGPDRLAHASMDIQLEVFRKQIAIAENVNKPVIIHAVKSFNEVVELKKQTGSDIPWIVHGFNGKTELAKMLLDHGMFLSFGAALLNQNSNAAKVLKVVPTEKLFFETDESQAGIKEIYKAASSILAMDFANLQMRISDNFSKVFINKNE